MSEPDAVPLPREGEVFFDVRGESRTMRLSWYADSSVAVFSIWQGNRCTGTFRLPFGDLVRMVETLQAGRRRESADHADRIPRYANAQPDPGYGYPAGRLRPAGPRYAPSAWLRPRTALRNRAWLRLRFRLRSGHTTVRRPVSAAAIKTTARVRAAGCERRVWPAGRLWRAAVRSRRSAGLPAGEPGQHGHFAGNASFTCTRGRVASQACASAPAATPRPPGYARTRATRKPAGYADPTGHSGPADYQEPPATQVSRQRRASTTTTPRPARRTDPGQHDE